MPTKPKRPCNWPGCAALSHGRFCPQHQQLVNQRRDQRRGTAAQRGYDSQWRAVRALVLARDGHRCCRCGATRGLQVHHLQPLSVGGARLDPANLVTLCSACHHRLHAAP